MILVNSSDLDLGGNPDLDLTVSLLEAERESPERLTCFLSALSVLCLVVSVKVRECASAVGLRLVVDLDLVSAFLPSRGWDHDNLNWLLYLV